ncbi:glutaredoxin family protein [Bacillus salacetis]|uniref:glutaredoxin family protein n=1 Tax=Bacillus salacetis TaxID=2315464 RepID=UPI003B9FBD5A
MLSLYTIDGCSKCHKVKNRLKALSIPFTENNILQNKSYAIELQKLNGEIITPALRIDNTFYTGCHLLQVLKEENVNELKNYPSS